MPQSARQQKLANAFKGLKVDVELDSSDSEYGSASTRSSALNTESFTLCTHAKDIASIKNAIDVIMETHKGMTETYISLMAEMLKKN